MSNAQAHFDCLFIAERMTDLVSGFSRAEQHLFTYASCLLSLCEGQPVAEWGYLFASTPNGLPSAEELNVAIDSALRYGYLATEGTLYRLTDDGRLELAIWLAMESNRDRIRYLTGATDALLVFSPGNVREAFDYDPAIRFLKKQKQPAWVFEEPEVDRLYTNFHEIRQLLAQNSKDLSVPLVAWLKYLITTGRVPAHGH
jgi:hypothetical protein